MEDLTDEQLERMCEICEECIFNRKMNTNQYNLCEGSRCDEAFEYYMEEVNEIKQERRRYLLISLK